MLFLKQITKPAKVSSPSENYYSYSSHLYYEFVGKLSCKLMSFKIVIWLFKDVALYLSNIQSSKHEVVQSEMLFSSSSIPRNTFFHKVGEFSQ